LVTGLEQEEGAAARRRTDAENSRADAQADSDHHPRADHHLRSVETVKAYHLHATDGEVGKVKGFLIDETWVIRYMVVDTDNSWRGHDVLISPEWIEDVQWDDNHVLVGLTCEAVKQAPAYYPGDPLTREREQDLCLHYGFGGYWAREVEPEDPELQFRPPKSA
jgi:hypothetical protein